MKSNIKYYSDYNKDKSNIDKFEKCYSDINQSINMEKNIENDVNFAPFLMWNDHNTKYFENLTNTIYTDNYNNTYENVAVMKEAYFSLENIDIIQIMIIKNIFYKSKETLKINKIKHESIIQIMHNIWINTCRYLPYNLKDQIKDLNNKVCNYIVPLLLNEYTFYKNYLRDSDVNSQQLLERPNKIVNSRKETLSSIF